MSSVRFASVGLWDRTGLRRIASWIAESWATQSRARSDGSPRPGGRLDGPIPRVLSPSHHVARWAPTGTVRSDTRRAQREDRDRDRGPGAWRVGYQWPLSLRAVA